MFGLFTFIPSQLGQKGEYWRVFSHALIHQNVFHLFFNTIILLLFGREVESYFLSTTQSYFLYPLLYLTSIPVSVAYRVLKSKQELDYRAVGSSGAVSAIVFAYIAIHPQQAFTIELFYPISIPAIWLGIMFLLYSLIMSLRRQDTIGHDAHLFGAIWGYAFTLYVFPNLRHFLLAAFH
jgi:membrane associated rhomboid family serine protease